MTLPQALQFHQAGRLAEAEALYRQILAAQPRNPDALHFLGVICLQTGRHEAAVEWIRQAIALNPDYPAAHCNLGEAFRAIGQLDQAAAHCRRAVELKLDFPEAHNNLGAALSEQGRLDQAIPAFHRALKLKPDYVEAHNNLGNALRDSGQPGEAVAAFHNALKLHPGYPEAHNNLGNTLRDLGQLDEAIAEFHRALQSPHPHPEFHSNLIYALHFHPGSDAQAIAAECARWEKQHAAPLRVSLRPHGNNRDPARRLKIGYVSPNFHGQAECYFVVPLFEAHDHSFYEIHAYSDVRRPDSITERLKKCVDFWHDTRALSHEQLAAQIRADGIDVLVDLSMHMGRNRLLVFARQPAPVQVAWLAYPGSTGLHTIGYRLTDAHMEPLKSPATREHEEAQGGAVSCRPHNSIAGAAPLSGEKPLWSAEEPIRLPDCWCCYDPIDEPPEINPLPALSAAGITFGSLNSFAKVNESVLARWARVLEAVETSRLLMLCPEGSPRERVHAIFHSRGIAAQRVEFVSLSPRREYLRLYHKIDLGLDPFPYNGITTTCDALWMGVPVLTLPGNVPASRAGLSLLSNAGLGEFAAHSEEDYVRLAIEWSQDLPRLANLRSSLRPRMQASPLMNAPRFARNIESAYRSMWQRWRAMS